MKRKFNFLFLFLCLVLILGGVVSAQEAPKYGGTLRVALTSEPPTLDFVTSTVASTRVVALHIFESLATYNKNFDVIPQLAESWDVSDDYTVYTFYLRRGVLFHNGKEMVAEDVKASIDRALEFSARKRDIAMVKEVKIIDDYTVQLTLDVPVANFISIFAMPIPGVPIMPKEAIEGVPGGQLRGTQLIGTGPFKFVEWQPTESITLARFKDYSADTRWDGPDGLGGNRAAFVDHLILGFVSEPGSRVAGLLAGTFDFADMLPTDDFPRLEADRNIDTYQIRPFAWLSLMLNNQRPPFDNIKMREAVRAALNHDEILHAAVGNPEFYRLNPSIFFEEQIWHDPVGDEMGLFFINDQEKAKKLLEEAGYKGERIRFLVTHSYDYYTKSSIVVSEQLRAIGLNVEINLVDLAGFVERMVNPDDFEMISFAITLRFDPTGHHSTFSGNAPFTFSSPDIDQLLSEALGESDFEKRYALYHEVHKILYQEVGWVMHGDIHELAGARGNVKGYEPFYMAKFWNVWLD